VIHAERLRTVPLFEGLDPEGLARLSAACRLRDMRAGQTLFFEGDEGTSLCIILSGKVSVQVNSSSGAVIHIADRGPGEHVGEMSLLDGETRSADVVATEPCRVLVLGRREFERALADYPKLSLNILQTLSRRLRQQAAYTAKTSSLDALGKVCLFLAEEQADGKVTMSQTAIAGRLGLSRETVNRALTQLVRLRAIILENRAIRVLDQAFLERRSEQI
jgi:CRP/FNR family transcriptional regulator, cyclic AMP receptor protein